jgi:hypothetical protein
VKRYLTLLGLGVLATSVGWSTPVCTSGSLADYIALGAGGCTIGDKLFSSFQYLASAGGGAVAPTSSEVSVAPFLGFGHPSIIFASGGWTAFQGQFVNSSIGFKVTVLDPTQDITSVNLGMAGGSIGTNTGAIISETVLYKGGSASTGVFNIQGVGPPFGTTGPLPAGLKEVIALKDILVTAFSAPEPLAFAKISIVLQTFVQTTAIPEPATMAGVGAALIGLYLLRRR